MKYFKIIFITAVGLISSMILFCQSGISEDKPKFTRGGESYNIPYDDIPILQELALKGAQEAAFRLSLYYGLVLQDTVEDMFWIRIAAENGHPIAQQTLGIRLSTYPDQRNRLRSEFWLKQAAMSGNAAPPKEVPVRNSENQKDSGK